MTTELCFESRDCVFTQFSNGDVAVQNIRALHGNVSKTAWTQAGNLWWYKFHGWYINYSKRTAKLAAWESKWKNLGFFQYFSRKSVREWMAWHQIRCHHAVPDFEQHLFRHLQHLATKCSCSLSSSMKCIASWSVQISHVMCQAPAILGSTGNRWSCTGSMVSCAHQPSRSLNGSESLETLF